MVMLDVGIQKAKRGRQNESNSHVGCNRYFANSIGSPFRLHLNVFFSPNGWKRSSHEPDGLIQRNRAGAIVPRFSNPHRSRYESIGF
jgi:hypothetical protein